jgi:predicted phosphoribosyltransferase
MPLMYRKMHLSARKWSSVGACINWQMKLTLNEKLSLVIVKYCSAPANERKAVGSTIKCCPTTNGVEIVLTSTIEAHCKRSRAYFV